jgi:hypothetical protein
VSTAAGGLRGAPLALGELSEKQRASLPALQVHAGLRVSCQPEQNAIYVLFLDLLHPL